MPWRHDFVQCFWVDPDWDGFSGYPMDKAPSRTAPEPAGPAHVRSSYVTRTASPDEARPPIGAAVTVLRDRTGFRYEREVGLDDFVTVRDAAQLLRVPAMTVTRWIKNQRIRSSKQHGVSVIRLREVLRVAQDRQRPVKLGTRLRILG
ncbi:MAG: helix-turn-helix domain-containing protein [bacterium]